MGSFNWQGRKVFVTGAGGFIGSHLCERLVKSGARLKAMVRYNSRGFWGWLEDTKILGDIEVCAGDITDRDAVQKFIKGQEVVFHLAALIGIPYSYEAAYSYVQTNIVGTLNVLQACLEAEVKRVIHTSTSETYGTAQYIPIDEKHPMVGQSPYSATKIAADQLALSFYKSFGLRLKIARLFNTYGPRQSARAVIPTIITQVLNSREKINLGNIYPTRDFTYVKDAAKGLIKLAESEKLFGEITNIGSNSEISMGDLAELIASLINNKKIDISGDTRRARPKESEVERLCCDYTKMEKNTSWKPQVKFEDGLKETIEWFKKNLCLYKADIYNV